MFTIRMKAIATAAFVLGCMQPASATQPAAEDARVAIRTVVVSQAALQGDAVALASLNHQLFAAAKSACSEEYPRALVVVTRICVSKTIGEALQQLNRMRSRLSAASATPAMQMILAVKAR